MRWDGDVLPTPTEAMVLHEFRLILSDALPGLAARWLAAEMADSPAVRSLAGENPHDPWTVEALLAATIDELGPSVPLATADRRAIAVEWMARNWLQHGNTRHAVNTLSQLAITNLDLDPRLDKFIGLNDEWEDPGTWGRTHEGLESTASRLLVELLHAPNTGR